MIEFSCRQCGKELKVDHSKAGLRGKCPRCSSIIIVPEASNSANEPIFVDDDNFFSDNDLNKLYKQFTKKFEKYIYGFRITTEKRGDRARFELATGDKRSQLVWLFDFKDNAGEGFLGIYSIVGKIRLMESAVRALQSVDAFGPYGISLDEDNQLILTTIAKIKNLDQESFDSSVVMIATKADELEEAIFGVDKL